MKKTILGSIAGLSLLTSSLAFGVYAPTSADTDLLDFFGAKVTGMYEKNPSKIERIGDKLELLVQGYSDETRIHYILHSLYLHISGLTNTVTVSVPAPVMQEPTMNTVTTPVAPTPVQAPAPVVTTAPTTNTSMQNTASVDGSYTMPMQNADVLGTLKANAYIKGNPNAKITILEFSDFQCPFCQMYSNAGTANSLIQEYDGNLNVAFVHFISATHPLAQKAAEATECAGAQGGSTAFFGLKEELFKASRIATRSDGSQISVPNPDATEISNAFDVANAAGNMNKDTFLTCLNNGDFAAKVISQSTLASQVQLEVRENGVRKNINITQTPTNVFFNNETGQYKKLDGNVSLEQWKQEILGLEPNL